MDESQYREEMRKDMRLLARFLLGVAILCTCALIVDALVIFTGRIYSLAARVLGPHYAQLAIGVLVAALGFFAHWFKSKNQRWYGMVEVCFGIATAFTIALRTSAGQVVLAQWASLVACAYVIARGLNNVSEAKLKVLIDP